MARRTLWVLAWATATLAAALNPAAAEDLYPEFRFADPPGSGPVPAGVVTFAVAVEHGIGEDPNTLAGVVAEILSHPRGWLADGVPGFRHGPGAADITFYFASPATADALCRPLRTGGYLSCHNQGRVVLNIERWRYGASQFWGTRTEYRTYLVNHEVGHYLGRSHLPCPARGAVAPVMMQQTKGLGGCTPNGFVVPDRVEKGPRRLVVR